jgi:hypothetical protein
MVVDGDAWYDAIDSMSPYGFRYRLDTIGRYIFLGLIWMVFIHVALVFMALLANLVVVYDGRV